MTHEIEAAALDGLGSSSRSTKHALPIGSPCPNCETVLQGPWCHVCGQKADAYQRSIWHLIAEAFEGLTHFDGRIWQTLPKLALQPGKLTKAFLDGHRAPQIPPFRLFLVVLVIVFFAGGSKLEGDMVTNVRPQKPVQVDKNNSFDMSLYKDDPKSSAVTKWTKERARYAVDHPEAMKRALEEWSHRFAILTLPMAALLLSGIFAFRKGVYVFDHLIFSMHSLSFQGLLFSAATLLGMLTPLAGWLFWLAPAHLFVHMRGVYGTGIFGTLVRMAILFVGSIIAVTILMIGLLFVGFATAH